MGKMRLKEMKYINWLQHADLIDLNSTIEPKTTFITQLEIWEQSR